MPITLYWTLLSQPSRAVKCLLQIGKIQHTLQQINLMANQTKSKEYLSVNPLGQIPFLIDDNFKLAESSAILVYLCEKYPQLKNYYGNTPQQRGLVNQFLSAYQSIYRPALFKIIFLKIYKGIKRGKPIKLSQFKVAQKEMLEAVQLLEIQIKKRGHIFLTGSKPTVADLIYFFQMTNFILYDIKIDRFPEVNRWYNRVLQIPQVRTLTETWKQMAPSVIEMFKNVPTVDDSKL